jgi:hypothetical protein
LIGLPEPAMNSLIIILRDPNNPSSQHQQA